MDFKNTIIILTSNIGSQYLLEGIDENGNIREEARDAVMGDLRAHFRPEFLNRLDEMILFKPLTKDNISRIVDLCVADVNKRLADRELKLRLTDAAKVFITDHGYDPVYGAPSSEALPSEECGNSGCTYHPCRWSRRRLRDRDRCRSTGRSPDCQGRIMVSLS